jgi:hypothetical protein
MASLLMNRTVMVKSCSQGVPLPKKVGHHCHKSIIYHQILKASVSSPDIHHFEKKTIIF